ncbi:hypothetical protein ABEB36_008699 [Hypothenemus hampei]|uniref:Protein kinase domain-containing protein n=1 Tax=Hypothenemus hampei TaxID=57062 RepID=A0ABD1EMS8_HYPHA
MSVDTNCSALYGDRNISASKKYIIQPNMHTLKHPAEPLMHGCTYGFNFYTEIIRKNTSYLISQQAIYEIPECVQEVCACGVRNAPFQYIETQLLFNNWYTIKFNKTNRYSSVSLETVFDKLWYSNLKSNKSVTIVPIEQIIFDNYTNALTLPFEDFQLGNSYNVYIDLLLDNCEYQFSFVITDIEKPSVFKFVIYTCLLLGLTIVCISILFKIKPQLWEQLRKHIGNLPRNQENSSNIKKEVINTQYTPLEFLEYKFDRFELPRNRIFLKNQIGGGAFGKVYKADILELGNRSRYVQAAVKMPLENAPSEEISDFLAEIETMKKIANCGGHSNVIRILSCVTIETPYIMVMELVPCGSLKSYLSQLRKKWEETQTKNIFKDDRHFFPDNMVVENYLPTLTVTPISEINNHLKYTDLAFSDYTGSVRSSETSSYITPDSPETPRVPNSKLMKHGITSKIFPGCLYASSPVTPNSTSSIGLPSITETLLTPLESASEASPSSLIIKNNEIFQPLLNSKELQSFALQIANGMAFLEGIGITHRDLAARNILIDENKTLKISDFGMARKGVYINTHHKRQPLRWMAPEAIENRRCDNKTDVWSFGVVLWEIGSLGAFPYKDLNNDQVFPFILQGKRLDRPETCTDQLYELMQQCWQTNPDDRLTFADIAKQFEENSGKIYVDFSKISEKYCFPPT